MLTSSNFAVVLERALDRATSLLFDGLSQNVFLGKEGEEEEVRLRTASVLPGLTRWSRLALDGLPNELVDVRSLSFRIRMHPRGLNYADFGYASVWQICTRWRALRRSYTRIMVTTSGDESIIYIPVVNVVLGLIFCCYCIRTNLVKLDQVKRARRTAWVDGVTALGRTNRWAG